MHRLYRYITALLLISLNQMAHAAIDTTKLVRVTPENNPTCVEFYQYKNDMYCSTTPLQSAPPDPAINHYEKQKLVFDDRPWLAAWGNQSPTITTVEYVPAGTSIDDWYELITTQFIPNLQNTVSPWSFAHNFIDSIKKRGLNPNVTFIENTDDYVLFEFKISGPANLAQHEIQLISKGKDGLYIVHYTIKVPDMDKANRDKWITNLKKSTISADQTGKS